MAYTLESRSLVITIWLANQLAKLFQIDLDENFLLAMELDFTLLEHMNLLNFH